MVQFTPSVNLLKVENMDITTELLISKQEQVIETLNKTVSALNQSLEIKNASLEHKDNEIKELQKLNKALGKYISMLEPKILFTSLN